MVSEREEMKEIQQLLSQWELRQGEKQSLEILIELNEREETELKSQQLRVKALFFLAFEHRIFARKNLNLAVFLICFNNFPV